MLRQGIKYHVVTNERQRPKKRPRPPEDNERRTGARCRRERLLDGRPRRRVGQRDLSDGRRLQTLALPRVRQRGRADARGTRHLCRTGTLGHLRDPARREWAGGDARRAGRLRQRGSAHGNRVPVLQDARGQASAGAGNAGTGGGDRRVGAGGLCRIPVVQPRCRRFAGRTVGRGRGEIPGRTDCPCHHPTRLRRRPRPHPRDDGPRAICVHPPMTGATRALMPDYLRLFALFGIVVVNVQYIAFSALGSFADPAGDTTLDAITLWLVNGLALLKTYGLFSFMFGVGLGFLMRSAARRGLPFGRVYRNRMIGLAVLGIAHGCLFFPGDILTIYAITGSILYLFRDWPVRRLVRVGAVLLILQVMTAPLLLLAVPETPPDIMALERFVLTEGTFLDAAAFRSIGFAFILPSFLVIQGLSALGWFCLGLAAVKSGMIDVAGHPLWQRARRWCLAPGVAVSLAGAAIWQWGDPVPGVLLTIAAAPVATLGYLGLIAGGSSLSVYLGQSIVLSTVFSGYGLDLWGEVDRLTAVAIALAVTAGLIAALAAWRTRFALGPFEWILRRITYAQLVT